MNYLILQGTLFQQAAALDMLTSDAVDGHGQPIYNEQNSLSEPEVNWVNINAEYVS